MRTPRSRLTRRLLIVGIAFAIPASTTSEIVDELIQNGSVVRGWLGVQIQPVTRDIAEALDLKDDHGALVTEPQEDSPAAKAGIRAGLHCGTPAYAAKAVGWGFDLDLRDGG